MKFPLAYEKFKEDCSKGKLMHLCYGTEDDLIQKWFDKMIVPYLEVEESIGKQYWRDQAITQHKLLERAELIMQKHIKSEPNKEIRSKLAKKADEIQYSKV